MINFTKNYKKKKKDLRIIKEYKKILFYKKKLNLFIKINQKVQVMLYLKQKNLSKINIF